jgi:hypothetical protein
METIICGLISNVDRHYKGRAIISTTAFCPENTVNFPPTSRTVDSVSTLIILERISQIKKDHLR